MAESIKQLMNALQAVQKPLEQAVPLLMTASRIEEGLQNVVEAAEQIQNLDFDPHFTELSTTMKILANSDSPILSTFNFQGYIVELLEMFTSLLNEVKNAGPPKESDALKMLHIGQYLINLSSRVTNRYKLNVLFEPEYEAKALRAFMVVKELSGVVRFLNLAPDISENQNANLDNGLEIDCLSQETPEDLHKLAGSVLEVQSVQIFRETRPLPVNMLDPPTNPDSFDTKISNFLNK